MSAFGMTENVSCDSLWHINLSASCDKLLYIKFACVTGCGHFVFFISVCLFVQS